MKLAGGVPVHLRTPISIRRSTRRTSPARARDDAVSLSGVGITGLEAALAILALMNILALFLTGRIPKVSRDPRRRLPTARQPLAATG